MKKIKLKTSNLKINKEKIVDLSRDELIKLHGGVAGSKVTDICTGGGDSGCCPTLPASLCQNPTQ